MEDARREHRVHAGALVAVARQQLLGRIQETYGITKDEAERQVRDFESGFEYERRS